MELDNVCSLSESPALENHVPYDPTVFTCVNQQDVLQTEKLPTQPSEWKSSSDWLQYHSLHMSELLSQHTAKIILQMDEGGTCGQQQISSEAVSELEFKLYQRIELYHGRIRWLNQGSRKVFGVIQGSRVGLIIDSSDANCSSTEFRLQELQTNLQCLIEEQLSTKKQLYLMSFGSDHSSLWDSPKDINASRLQEAHGWVRELRPMGNCNLLQALQRGLELGPSRLDSLVIILGSRTEQTPDAIAEYAEQCTLGQELSVHVVSYCSSSVTSTVKRLAEVTHGRYHVVTASWCVVDDSTDVGVLRQEIQVARDLLSQTEALHQGHLEDMVTVLEDMTVSGTDGELQMSAEREDLSLLLPCPANRSCLLNIKPSGVQDICSADWLHSNGLKAKRLGLYQVLSPNAYSPVEQFVPILNKTVTSTVHEKAMVQFEWHDGTVKNLHVDLPCIFNYQKQLQAEVCALERRVQWLSYGSRQIWGAVCEKRVQILVDMSLMNSSLSLPIDLFLKRLLEEQLSNTHSFNIITFGSSVTMWRERMAPPTPENLGDAWQWFQGVQYSGNSTTLDGLRQALVGILHDKCGSGGASSDHLTQGVYLLTSGLPVQEMGELCSYASESCSHQRLHVCLCTNTEEDKHPSVGYTDLHRTAGALRELAQAGRGRFHWCTEEGIMESDDITLLTEEMEQAASYWEKSFELVEALTQRGNCTCPGEVVPPGQNGSALIPLDPRSSRDGPIPPPKPTALTIARLQAKSEVSSTARAYTPPGNSGQSMSGKRPLSTKSKQKKCNYASQSFFYLEDGNLGVMFKSYPKPKSVRKSIPSVALPKQEDLCSTKQWLKRYSVRRLKLDLHRLLSGPDCAHGKKRVPSVLKAVSARYCSIFPTVQINGAVKHLQLTPGELEDYLCQTQRLLQRYLQRLHWLLTGSRRVFGTVLEKDVCVLVDVSGSMAPSLAKLKRDLSSLIWDQLHHNKIRFSLVAFSGEVRVWRTALQEPSEEQCLSAVEWVSQLDTHGCTNTLGALQTACGFEDSVGLYLLSDGKPDCSCSLVLRETKRLTTGRPITVHTVSYNCSDSAANDFLRDMAHQTGGRYHRSHDDADTLTPRLLASRGRDVDSPELPDFEGDDLRGLAREINKLGLFRKQAQSFRDIITKKSADTS